MGRSRKPTDKKSVDVLMRKLASTLVSDFQTNFNDPGFCCDFQSEVRLGNITRAREVAPTPDETMDIPRFKAAYQVQSVLKRYRFRKDTYTDQELTDKAVKTYLETQARLTATNLSKLPTASQLILDVAARYIARVLGPYNDDECRDRSRFGSGASVGIPARVACEAARWELPISGSQAQVNWFDSEMSQIGSVQEYWAKQKGSAPHKGATYQLTDTLTLSLVPKSFKAMRSIMPNTTIGSYLTDGIGKMLRVRLKREGYDISTLQERHKSLARSASIHTLYTTADLSSASDSISVALVRRLFPSDWFEIMNQNRIGKVRLPDGRVVESLTFCTMGIGYTFPLQTLVFLSLLHAIQLVHYGRFDRRLISVYGDDLIYSSRMHLFVAFYLEQFGFILNEEKTFSSGHFRESCGGDFYHGVDVRPFQPQNGSASVSCKTYEAILYKYINTLLMRWSEYEIGMTLRLLASELLTVTQRIKIVPVDFPDDSGVKSHPQRIWSFLDPAHVSKPKHVGHGVYRFSFLRLVPDEREETRHEPYLWNALRDFDPHPVYSGGDLSHEAPRFYVEQINRSTGIDGVSPHLSFITRECEPVKSFRSQSGRRLRRTVTNVTISHTGHYRRQSGTSSFEDRR